MSKPKDDTPTKTDRVFPAPEWMSVSSSLAAALAHEIRNPLLSIKGAAQLLEQVVGEDDKSLAQLIIKEAMRIEQLVATMDPLTPNPAVAMELLNIHEVTEYVRLAARGIAPQVQVVAQYDPSLPEIRGVHEALVQALMNVVKNALEAIADMPDGAITLTTRYLAGERMQRLDGGKLNIHVSVTDNGAGVAQALVPRLFTPFASAKENGKGLGLAIAAKIVEEHGGLIAYDVPPDGGARFSIYLPVAS